MKWSNMDLHEDIEVIVRPSLSEQDFKTEIQFSMEYSRNLSVCSGGDQCRS